MDPQAEQHMARPIALMPTMAVAVVVIMVVLVAAIYRSHVERYALYLDKFL